MAAIQRALCIAFSVPGTAPDPFRRGRMLPRLRSEVHVLLTIHGAHEERTQRNHHREQEPNVARHTFVDQGTSPHKA